MKLVGQRKATVVNVNVKRLVYSILSFTLITNTAWSFTRQLKLGYYPLRKDTAKTLLLLSGS